MPDLFDPVVLARLQFAFTISAHIFFPAFTIGLASYLAVLEGLWIATKDDAYIKIYDYWKVIFAVTFGMGVVSGIVMSYQFGTNWSVFSDKVGPVLGPLMGYEVLTAFFLEAGFLGVMLFGREKVGPTLHFIATLIVAVGTLLSAFWILSVNSWMHTPQGHAFNDVGQFIPEDWFAIVFNPSFPYRFVHMVLAAYLTTAFVVGAGAAWHLLQDNRDQPARKMFSMAMWMALLVTPIQVYVGDLHGLNTFEHQPAKVAAMEGHYETQRGAPLYLFGVPDDEAEVTRYAVGVPKLGSLILTHDWDGEVPGLKEWPREDRPPAEIVFYSFRIMVGVGILMLIVGLWSGIARLRGTLYTSRWLHRAAFVLGPSGFLAVLAGWITTEVGRQPYTVHELLRTSESVSPIDATAVGTSLVVFVLVYAAVFGSGTFYILRLMSNRPDVGIEQEITPLRSAGITPAAGYGKRKSLIDRRGGREHAE
ncbi:MAG TPA: cytochrome ubiquinol oxidase subunit I [Steroidobacteraceae bacterium]|nr:cytochrome ubiquinol oxidase subunit I [Steroidobacteraceae bacterium]